MKKLNLLTLILLFITTTLLANNERALYIKKYSKETKTALVIGNANYSYFSKLKNSKNDAKDMKNLLEQKGFKVHYLKNATLKKMEKTVDKFIADLKGGGIGMLYYAGHGIEVNGKNYLIPVDMEKSTKIDIKYDALAVNEVIEKMEDARNRLNILVLDACRNDPFSRSGGGGLAPINNAKGMYVAYATAPGDVASDGGGKNGLFTKHLIKEMNKPQTLEKVFKNTRVAVMKESNERQLPWTSSSVMGDFYFTIPSESVTPQTKRKEYPKAQKQSTISFESNEPTTYSLTVNSTPSNAKVSITNIKLKYYDGVQLEVGKYKVKVSANGYYSKTGTIDLQSDINVDIRLKKKPVEKITVSNKSSETSKPIKSTLYTYSKITKKNYDRYCSMCHDTGVGPVAGDRNAWNQILSKGLDKVLNNAINGTNTGMPPKGGSALTDKQIEDIVRYMTGSNPNNTTNNSIIKDKHGNTYKTVTSRYTGKVWLDRNLGAKRVCQSYNDTQCYGEYFQWGRDADGHEKQNSSTTSSISSSSTPSHSKFIKSSSDNRYDWLRSQNDNLWQGVNGKNNPCPKGFRIPTIDELKKETLSQNVKNRDDAFKNFLRLPSAGYRDARSGSMDGQGSWGNLWSSSLGGKYARTLYFSSDYAIDYWGHRANGFSVRCTKD
jgi:cytochrome c5